jgi:hypothetical protein
MLPAYFNVLTGSREQGEVQIRLYGALL